MVSLLENPYAEFKMFDAMMFILRSPGIAMMHKNAAGKEIIKEVEEEKAEGLGGAADTTAAESSGKDKKESEKVLFPPADIIDKAPEENEKTNKKNVQIKKKT